MRSLAIARSPLGADVPILSSFVSDVEASARAQLYQQLADFQALPQRVNVVIAQLNALTNDAPARTLDDSLRLEGLQAAVADAQQQWSGTNATVTRAIAEIGGGADAGTIARDVAAAISGMALVTNAVQDLESGTRDLIASATGLSAVDRQQLLAMSTPFSSNLTTLAKWAIGGFVLYKIARAVLG